MLKPASWLAWTVEVIEPSLLLAVVPPLAFHCQATKGSFSALKAPELLCTVKPSVLKEASLPAWVYSAAVVSLPRNLVTPLVLSASWWPLS